MEIRKVGVVGLGTMGAGIAQISVQSGFETVGREVSDELGERGRTTIERYLTRGVEKGRLSEGERDAALDRLTLTTELGELADCDLVIEAALEDAGVGIPPGPDSVINLHSTNSYIALRYAVLMRNLLAPRAGPPFCK